MLEKFQQHFVRMIAKTVQKSLNNLRVFVTPVLHTLNNKKSIFKRNCCASGRINFSLK
jgi:hypothetical protein